MSQIGSFRLSDDISTITTDAGTVTPDASNNIDVVGGSNINTAGAGSVLTINLDDAITLTTVNATTFDTNVAAAGVTLVGTTLSADGTDADINVNINAKGAGQVIINDLDLISPLVVGSGGTGASTLTDHGVLVGSGTGAITPLAVGTDGQVLIGSSGADPVFASLTSTDGTINYTTGAGTLDLSATTLTDDAFSGFSAWDGAGPYFDDSVLGTFTLSQSGSGYIQGVLVSFAAPQSVTGMTAGNTYYIYIDNTGTLQKTTTLTETLIKENIVLFECLRDSTTAANLQLTVKENNLYTMPYHTEWYLHSVVGSVISDNNSGANIVIGLIPTEVAISGADTLEDHGLTTNITDTGGGGVDWHQYFTNASGKWERWALSDVFSGKWNSGGTPTNPTAGKYQVYTLYVLKDDLNSSTPQYLAILNTSEYATQVAAQTAISDGAVATATAELAALEPARLGYIIYEEASSQVIEALIDKQTLRSANSVNGTNQASLILTNVTNFDGILSATNTTSQSALETIDEWGKATTDHALLIGNGTGSAIGSLAVGATGEILTGVTGADPAWSATPTVTTINATTFDTNVAAAGLTLSGTTLSADGTDANISINITPKGTGEVIIDSLNLISPLDVGYGGTGASTLTDHGVLVGSGTGAITALTVGTNGQVLVGSTGADPVFANISAGTGMTVTEGAGTLALSSTATTIVNETGTTYEFLATDVGKFVTFSNASAITVTVPVNADVSIAVGSMIGWMQLGAGTVTFAPEAGVTIRSEGTLLSANGQYAAGLLTKIATDTWCLSGNRA